MKKANGQRGPEKLDQNDPASTATKLATTFGVSEPTIERDGQFARAVEDLKQADPTIEQRVHGGKVSKQSVVAAAKVMARNIQGLGVPKGNTKELPNP